MKRNTIIISLLSIFSLITLIGMNKADPVLDRILGKYNRFASLYHIQKVYIHTDKNIYKSGEHIWFKFYLFSDSHHLDTVSKIGYVELVDPNMNITQVRILKLHNGIGTGDFWVNDSMASGIYMIRAYTNLMKNFGEQFFFKKLITIKNPHITYLNEDLYLDIKSLETKKHRLKITYNLSGNSLVAGIKNTIFIQVSDYLGNPVKAMLLLKENHHIIKSLHTDSLGFAQLDLVPQKDKKYKIIARSGKAKGKIELKQPQTHGYQLNISSDKTNFYIKLITRLPQTADKQFRTVYLLAERNGKVFFTATGFLQQDSLLFTIPRHSLPRGVVHIVLFNGQGKPAMDQLVFNGKIHTIPLKVWLKNLGNNLYKINIQTDTSVFASTSIAVTTSLVKDPANIVDYLSLKADIPQAKTSLIHSGKINTYIHTFHWMRYSPADIWINKIDTPRFKVQKSLIVKGKVTKLIMDLPVSHTLVTLTVLNSYNDQYQTYTDRQGRFYFRGLNYPDTIIALVEARAKNGSKNVLVYIDKYDTIPTSFAPIKHFRKIRLKQMQTPQYQQWHGSEGTLHSHVDQVIYMKDIETSGYTNVFDLLKGRVPGYYKMGNEIFFRGPSSITQNYEPLYLLDNVPVDRSTIENLNLEDIERIEIIKNAAYSAIYGARGANGVIAVYTKKGHFIQRGYAREIQPGFYTPGRFQPLPDSLLIKIPFATFYWNAQLIINKGTASSTFHLPQDIKSIQINIQGVDRQGRIINYQKDFTLIK